MQKSSDVLALRVYDNIIEVFYVHLCFLSMAIVAFIWEKYGLSFTWLLAYCFQILLTVFSNEIYTALILFRRVSK